ncbi:hypothetical protein BOX15_Mlig015216g2, partial [Macrostomum lignano]
VQIQILWRILCQRKSALKKKMTKESGSPIDEEKPRTPGSRQGSAKSGKSARSEGARSDKSAAKSDRSAGAKSDKSAAAKSVKSAPRSTRSAKSPKESAEGQREEEARSPGAPAAEDETKELHEPPEDEDAGAERAEGSEDRHQHEAEGGLEAIDEEAIRDEVEALNKELDNIQISVPTFNEFVQHETEFRFKEFPVSYHENTVTEDIVLSYAANFRRQYSHLEKDRKPLFLNPLNECNVEKFVCTTLNPTKLPYRELYDWHGAASFVADYLNYVLLDPPTELPERMFSPATTLEIQKGHCFEYSQLLCSLLLGCGYDAYVVSGYATREICMMDESRDTCPELQKKEEAKREDTAVEQKKYTVKPPKDLRSQFILNMEARKVREEQEREEERRKEAVRRELEAERPANDPLYGLRVHSWVLVLAGKREVPEGFFIEPLTGVARPLVNDDYCGIESLWNHKNYYVNMQSCREGVRKLSYDLGDCTLWEFMFPSNEKPLYLLPEVKENRDDEEGDEDNERAEDIERHLDMPKTWTKPIVLSRRDFETRCPHGKKTKLYKKAKLEKFAPYLLRDGMVLRLSIYTDRTLSDLVEVREHFENRVDKLTLRVRDVASGKVTEHFAKGRMERLHEHQYFEAMPGPETERVMFFYNEARVDCLARREEWPLEMKEYFVNRPDRLYFRHTVFSKRVKKFAPQSAPGEHEVRPISRIEEKFARNPNVPANEDVAERMFVLTEDRIQLVYHTDSSKIAASTREYIKPPNADEKGTVIVLPPDNHSTFQVDPNRSSKKEVEVYQLMLDLIAIEEKTKERVRASEKESLDILNARSREEADAEMEISLYDTERNEKAKKHREELERQRQEELMRNRELELDYLAPFLAQLGEPTKITKEIAFELRKVCLEDFKHRLIDKANLIQSRFERQSADLQKKQSWYQQNQVNMSKNDEEEYLKYCSEAMFKIQILEEMLQRHKNMAPHKFQALELKLRTDPRLQEFLN